MALVVATVVAASIAGVVRGGTVRWLTTVHVRWWPVLALGALALLAAWTTGADSWVVLAAAYVLLVVGALVNLHLVGATVFALGVLCNLVPLVAYRAVPVSVDAALAAEIVDKRAELEDADLGPARRPERDSDELVMLGAVVPIAPLDLVVGFGDLIALAGLANVVYRAVRTAPRRHEARPQPSWRASTAYTPVPATPVRRAAAVVIDLREKRHDLPPLPRGVRVPASPSELRRSERRRPDPVGAQATSSASPAHD